MNKRDQRALLRSVWDRALATLKRELHPSETYESDVWCDDDREWTGPEVESACGYVFDEIEAFIKSRRSIPPWESI